MVISAAMGYKAKASVKRLVMAGASVVVPDGRKSAQMGAYTYVVIDFNAWFRSFNFDGATSPRAAIHKFWGSILSDVPNAEVVVICFDDYLKNNEMRHR